MAGRKAGVRFGDSFVMEQSAKRRKWQGKGVKAGHGGDFDLGFETQFNKNFESQFEEVNLDVCAAMLDTTDLPDWLVAIINKDPEIQRAIADKNYKPNSPHKQRLVHAGRKVEKIASNKAEHWLQVRLCYELERQYPDLYDCWKAIPNGGSRPPRTAASMKYEGQKGGAADLEFDLPRGAYHGMKLEVKTEKGRPSKVQKDAQKRNAGKGYYHVIAKGFEECWCHIVAYLALPEFNNKTKLNLNET